MPSWPGSVPYKPNRGSWQIAEPYRANLESEMQAGNIRARRQYTAVIAVVSGTIDMASAEFAIFKAWVRDDLKSGTLEFTMPIWDGSAYVTKTCRIRNSGRYGPVQESSIMRVSVPLSLDVRGL